MKIHTLLPVLSIAMTVLTIAVTALVRRRSASTLSALFVLGALLVPSVAGLFALRLRELHQIALYMREGFAGEFGGAFALLLFSVLYGRKEPMEELKKSAPLLLLVGIGALFSSDLLLTEPGFVRLLLVPPDRLLLIGNSGISAASFFLSGILLLAFFQMAKTYSAASTLERWNLKYPMIGVSLWAFSVLVVHGTLVVGNGFDRVFLYLEEVGLLLTDGFFLYAFLVQRPQDVALALTRQTINRSVLFLLGGGRVWWFWRDWQTPWGRWVRSGGASPSVSPWSWGWEPSWWSSPRTVSDGSSRNFWGFTSTPTGTTTGRPG